MDYIERTAGFRSMTLRKAAIVAGIGLLIMTVLAPFAEFYVMRNLVVPGNAAKTVANISASGGLFSAAVFSFIVVVACDVLVAWALYVFLKPAGRGLSLVAAWFRLLYAAVFAVALNRCAEVLQLVRGSGGYAGEGLNNQVMLSLGLFRTGWDIALVFFSVHLVILGYLAFRAGYVPKILGALLVIAGLGYFADSFGKLAIPDYKLAVAAFTFVGEPLFMFWLIWKGIRGFERPLSAENPAG